MKIKEVWPESKFVPIRIVKSTKTKEQRKRDKAIRAARPRNNRQTVSAQVSWLKSCKKARSIKRREKFRAAQN